MQPLDRESTLVIMAAGMGSRFGGLKQLTPVGPAGEMIIDYSVYDALAAGFRRVVFVIKRENEAEFREKIGDRMAPHIQVEYVFQELTRLPAGIPAVPREKPWGTGHAVMCCQGQVNGPFVVINADDYYGPACFQLLHDFLADSHAGSDKLHLAMAGYVLENTLTENGYVSRGVCTIDSEHYLTDIVERVRIEKRDGGAAFTEDGGQTWEPLPRGCTVSMNCWAFPAGALEKFEEVFRAFYHDPATDPIKSEFYLPYVVDRLVIAGEADVKVLKTPDRWYGMTYREDRQQVIDAIHSLTEAGRYPARLWG
ncbi:MAG: NTP transferase domain-containing protein [Clostridiales bacterium]|nr:NTP transferase domain-containing protein [Clostridiales bacterium]